MSIYDLEERFYGKVDLCGACWLWTGARNSTGYGSILKEGKTALAHRVSFEIHNGPIKDGMCILHHCDNPWCVNPEHLYEGTKADNARDMVERGRFQVKHGVTNGAAKLSDEQVAEVRRVYAAGGMTQQAVAERFDITQSYVSKIVLHQSRDQSDKTSITA